MKQASPNQSESDPDEEEGGETGLGRECYLVSETIVSRRLEAQGGEGPTWSVCLRLAGNPSMPDFSQMRRKLVGQKAVMFPGEGAEP